MMRARPVGEFACRPVDWFWLARLAFGKPALLEGDPGLSKSLVALDLCARLSTGRPLPDGSAGGPARNALIVAEDYVEDTIRPRLEALGADLGRVFVLTPGEEDTGVLCLPSQVAVLERELKATDAKLVVIDTIVDFLDPGVNLASAQSVRLALAPLFRLAHKYRCCLLLLRHLNKTGRSQSIYRGGGSIAFVAACRAAWLIARDPELPERCVLAQVKNNLAPPQPSLVYTVTGRDTARPTLTWLGQVPWTANQLLAAAGRTPGLPARNRAQSFLADFLAAGPRTTREIWEASHTKGLIRRTLHRAKKLLNIRTVPVTLDGRRHTYWLLPGQQLPAHVPAEAAPPDVEAWLAPLREQFPTPTPLDNL
jgi:hypothetical protein